MIKGFNIFCRSFALKDMQIYAVREFASIVE